MTVLTRNQSVVLNCPTVRYKETVTVMSQADVNGWKQKAPYLTTLQIIITSIRSTYVDVYHLSG